MLCFDIETGPLPQDELLKLYTPPTLTEEFDESAVDIGQAKVEKTIRAKIDAARREWEWQHNNWGVYVGKHCEEWLAATLDKAALSPLTGRILAIGIQDASGFGILDGGTKEKEETILNSFWSHYEHCHAHSILMPGHNSHGFDLPFIIRRSWFHDIAIPDDVIQPNGRYLNNLFVDLMKLWCIGQVGGNGFVSLDLLAKAFGVGAKNGDGKDFANLWANDREKAIEYLRNDLDMTYQVAVRMGIS